MQKRSGSPWDSAATEELESRFTRRLVIMFVSFMVFAMVVVLAVIFRPATVKVVDRVWEVDKSTGIVRQLGMLEDLELTAKQSNDRNLVMWYTIYRETYGPALYRDVEMVRRYSSPEVRATFNAQADELYERVGSSMEARIDIDRMIMTSNDIATVMFTKTIKTDRGLVDKVKWTATVTYEFRDMSGELIKDIDFNPRGFQVTSYNLVRDTIQEPKL